MGLRSCELESLDWDTPLLPQLFIATLLRQIYADTEAGEDAILNSPLDWTIVYPVGLTDGPKTGPIASVSDSPFRASRAFRAPTLLTF